MLNSISQKRSIRLFAIIMILSMFFTATLAFAVVVTEKIKAKKGGTIYIDEGVDLVVPPGALDKNTRITVKMYRSRQKTIFEFLPELAFNVPVELRATYDSLSDAQSLDLYLADPNDPENYIAKIKPVEYDWGVTWYLDHFSIYYYRRR